MNKIYEENYFANKYFYTLWKKSTFLPYRVKKHHPTLEMDTFKDMLLLSYLAHDFKSPYINTSFKRIKL